MHKLILPLALLITCSLSACAEKEFQKGLTNVWSSGAGNASGAPVFSSEANKDSTAKKTPAPAK